MSSQRQQGPDIVLEGHCLFCLRNFSSSSTSRRRDGDPLSSHDNCGGDMEEVEENGTRHGKMSLSKEKPVVQVKNPGIICAFQNLWQYLQSSPERDGGAERNQNASFKNRSEDVASPVPPMCTNCFKYIVKLDELHVEFEIVKRKLHTHASRVRRLIAECGKGGVYSSRLDKFENSLGSSSTVTLSSILSTMEFIYQLRGSRYCHESANAEMTSAATEESPRRVVKVIRNSGAVSPINEGFNTDEEEDEDENESGTDYHVGRIKLEKMSDSEFDSEGNDDYFQDDEVPNQQRSSARIKSVERDGDNYSLKRKIKPKTTKKKRIRNRESATPNTHSKDEFNSRTSKETVTALIAEKSERITFCKNEVGKSSAWESFEVVYLDGIRVSFVRCDYCKEIFTWKSHCTSTLLRHACKCRAAAGVI